MKLATVGGSLQSRFDFHRGLVTVAVLPTPDAPDPEQVFCNVTEDDGGRVSLRDPMPPALLAVATREEILDSVRDEALRVWSERVQ